MFPQLRSLIWKEWHERKWWLALGAAWIVLGVVHAIWYETAHRFHAPVASYYTICMLYGLFAAVFLAMRTSLGEVTQKTLGFSSSLPVSLRRLAWVRLGGAVASLAGPIVLGALLMWVVLGMHLVEQAPARNPDRSFYVPLSQRPLLSALEAAELVWRVAMITVASSVQLLLILSIIGARRRAESRVGFIGACMAFVWFLLHFFVSEFRNDLAADRTAVFLCSMVFPQSLAVNYGYGSTDGSWGDICLGRSVPLSLAANLLVLMALAAWFARRYGTRLITSGDANPAWHRWRLPAILSRLPIRWPRRMAALVWLDLRQAVPMCVAGLVLACLMVTLEVVSNSGVNSSLPLRIAGRLSEGTWVVATLWGAVVGSGVFASEFEPRLEQFWRSRPISPCAWYWVKFLTGLTAVLAVLDLVTILVSWNSQYTTNNQFLRGTR